MTSRRNVLKSAAILGGFSLLGFSSGCGTSTVLGYLEDILALAEGALALVPGLPPVLVALIDKYLNAVSDAVDQTAALIPADGVVTPAIDAQIALIWVSVVAPVLPPGVAQNVANVILKIGPAIVKFLKSVGIIPTTGAALTGHPTYKATMKANVTIAPAQMTKVQALQARAKVLVLATRQK